VAKLRRKPTVAAVEPAPAIEPTEPFAEFMATADLVKDI
jgi:hypothetical protein